MQHRIHVITLAVQDLERSLAFYRDGLGLPSDGIIGTEWERTATQPGGATATFMLQGGLILALYGRADLASDANVTELPAQPGHFSVGHAVGSRQEVDEVLARAQMAGARLTEQAHDRPWGIYSGYFEDPDRHLWEIIYNPALDDSFLHLENSSDG
ncbi:MAG: VOC family protein [Chloroflexi bacterium]|nr:VOC family protein [Chloroflexota bacterium]